MIMAPPVFTVFYAKAIERSGDKNGKAEEIALSSGDTYSHCWLNFKILRLYINSSDNSLIILKSYTNISYSEQTM